MMTNKAPEMATTKTATASTTGTSSVTVAMRDARRISVRVRHVEEVLRGPARNLDQPEGALSAGARAPTGQPHPFSEGDFARRDTRRVTLEPETAERARRETTKT
jgi:hypothetical protein